MLPGPGALAGFVRFVPDQMNDSIFRGESSKALGLVLGYPPKNVVGVAEVESAISLTGEDVNEEGHKQKSLGPGFRRGEREGG